MSTAHLEHFGVNRQHLCLELLMLRCQCQVIAPRSSDLQIQRDRIVLLTAMLPLIDIHFV